MKKTIITFVFCIWSIVGISQNTSVEKSIFGVQTGLLGFWVHNEIKLTNQIALRSELGLDAGIFGGSFYDNTSFLLTPVITLSPRWYYNLNKRFSNSKKTKNNNANFLALKMSYNPDWFVISNSKNLRVVNQVSIIPTWGLRRIIGEHFTFETGIGVGYRYIFAKQAGFLKNESEAAGNLHLRIGYQF